MIVYNQQNQISADRWNVWIFTVEWDIFENSSVESDCMDRYDVNEPADRQI